MLRGQNSRFPQKSVSPNTLRYTWEINNQLTIMNSWTVALYELNSGTELCPQTAFGLNPLASSPPAILIAAYSSYWDSPGCVLHASVTSTIKATVEPNSAAWLLLTITTPAAISSFLSPFLMLSTTVIPMLISTSLHIPCWSCQHEPSFAYFILNPILLSHAFSGYSLRWLLPTFTPPAMPTCIAMLTKPSTTAKAGAL